MLFIGSAGLKNNQSRRDPDGILKERRQEKFGVAN